MRGGRARRILGGTAQRKRISAQQGDARRIAEDARAPRLPQLLLAATVAACAVAGVCALVTRSFAPAELAAQWAVGLVLGAQVALFWRARSLSRSVIPLWIIVLFVTAVPPAVLILWLKAALPPEVGMPLLAIMFWGAGSLAAGRTVERRFRAWSLSRGRERNWLPITALAVISALGGIGLPLTTLQNVASPAPHQNFVTQYSCNGAVSPFHIRSQVTVTYDHGYPFTAPVTNGSVEWDAPFYWDQEEIVLQLLDTEPPTVQDRRVWAQDPYGVYLAMLWRIASLGFAQPPAQTTGGWEFTEQPC